MIDAYHAAVESVALHDVSRMGRVRFSGPEHLDFLHRMSTNRTLDRHLGEGFETVFCDPRGRVGDLALLCRMAADETVAFVGPGRVGPLLTWLDRYRFAEPLEWFDMTAHTAQLELVGPQAASLAAAVLALDPLGVSVLERLARTGPVQALRSDAGGHPGLRLWGPAPEVEECRRRLEVAGAATLTPEAWDVLRVEWGQPASGRELTLDHNPWEAGLDRAVHLDKGCYIGQEVLARLDTYQKVKQHLVGLRLVGEADPGDAVEAGGREVGTVTSVARSPRLGLLALAYVRTAHCSPRTAVRVAGAAAEVSALPFAT